MNKEKLQMGWETLEGEHLKMLTELGLHGLSKHRFGEHIFELARGGERIEDPRLNVEMAGLQTGFMR
jgi:hypothetical protein